MDNVSVRKSLKIGPVSIDNKQNITIYDYKTSGHKTFNAPKENVDKFVNTLTEVKNKSAKILGISTLAGSTGAAAIGLFSKNHKAAKALVGALVGTIGGFFVGVNLASLQGKKAILKAQTDLLENNTSNQ